MSQPNHLAAARQRDVHAKRDRVIASVARLHGTGQRVTIAHVARDAQVSTWFIYNTPTLLTAVRDAMRDQLESGPRQTVETAAPVSSHSLSTDLALAREEIRDLRLERDRLRTRVQLALGADLDAITRSDFIGRIDTLETENAALRAQLSAVTAESARQAAMIDRLTEDLDGARLSLRRMMRQGAP